MLKVLPVFVLALVLSTLNSSAQCVPSLSACTLRVSTDPLCMIPDSAEMPPGIVNEPYDRNIHFIFEASITVDKNPQTGDTLPFPVTGTLEYMVFDSIGNLPPGITYEFVSGNPADTPGLFTPFNGNKAHGCIWLHGTPTETNTPSTNGANIYIKPHGCVLGGVLCGDFPWTIVYRVPIDFPEGISQASAVEKLSVISDLTERQLKIDLQSVIHIESKLLINDLTGRILLEMPLSIRQGNNQFLVPFHEAKGFYILQVSTPNGIRTQRFIW